RFGRNDVIRIRIGRCVFYPCRHSVFSRLCAQRLLLQSTAQSPTSNRQLVVSRPAVYLPRTPVFFTSRSTKNANCNPLNEISNRTPHLSVPLIQLSHH